LALGPRFRGDERLKGLRTLSPFVPAKAGTQHFVLTQPFSTFAIAAANTRAPSTMTSSEVFSAQ